MTTFTLFKISFSFYLITLGVELSSGKRNDDCKLKSLFVVFRHGSRAPVATIPGDPNNEFWSKMCLGDLTNVGMDQQVDNGKQTRDRYGHFLGERYNCSEFSIRSTTITRAVLSGNCFAAGLYTPIEKKEWSKDKLAKYWLPIPVLTTLDDPTVSSNTFPVPNVSIRNSSVYLKHKDAVDAIVKAVGVPLDTNVFVLFSFVDALIAEDYLGLDLPFNLKKYKDQFVPINGEMFADIVSTVYPLSASPILQDMVGRIDSLNNGSSTVKTSIYSMHDLHVAALLFAVTDLPKYEIGEPPFSSTLYFEVCANSNNVDYVKLFYRPHINSDITQLALKECGKKCTLADFKNIVNKV